MREITDYNYLKISDLQKLTSQKLAKLAKRPILITERSRPQYLIIPAGQAYSQNSDYQYLVARPHPWKKQLFIKGRNMSVKNLVYTLKKERMTPEEIAKDFDLPVDAVLEALHYYEHNKALIELETLEEKRRLESLQKRNS